jgi:uncharacterized protein (DUF302 family)
MQAPISHDETFAAPSDIRATHLPEVPAQEALARLLQSLRAEGFSISATVDLADLYSRRLDADVEPCFVVHACHLALTQRAQAVAREGALLTSVAFCIWKERSGSTIATLEPDRAAAAIGRPHLRNVAATLAERLDRVDGHLSQPAPQETPAPAMALDLEGSELRVLREATIRHVEELSAEVARTDSRALQHALSRTIDRLEAIAHKLEVAEGQSASAAQIH